MRCVRGFRRAAVCALMALLQGAAIAQAPQVDLDPVIAALAAPGATSRLRGIAHLRGHETDRLAALTAEINRLGGRCEETADGLSIVAGPLHGGEWLSYADHRMATAGAIVGLRTPGVEVRDIGTTAKTLPDFPGMWADMLGER